MLKSFDSARALSAGLLVGVCAAAQPTSCFAVVFGQLDDFQGGTVANWTEGAASLNPPTLIPGGGPGGAVDAYLQNISSGGFGPGSKLAMFNTIQWAGDYVAANVTRIDAMMRNPGSTDLYMRAAIQGGAFGTRFASTNAIFIPAGSTWIPVTFELTASKLTNIGGPDTLTDVLTNMAELRLLSAQFGPGHQGDSIVATAEFDNIRALHLPGDANFDNIVNLDDFNILATNFGTGGQTWTGADFNFDGLVNLDDFNLLASNFGLTAGPDGPAASDWSALAASVPEPAVVAPLVATMMLCARRVRAGDAQRSQSRKGAKWKSFLPLCLL